MVELNTESYSTPDHDYKVSKGEHYRVGTLAVQLDLPVWSLDNHTHTFARRGELQHIEDLVALLGSQHVHLNIVRRASLKYKAEFLCALHQCSFIWELQQRY